MRICVWKDTDVSSIGGDHLISVAGPSSYPTDTMIVVDPNSVPSLWETAMHDPVLKEHLEKKRPLILIVDHGIPNSWAPSWSRTIRAFVPSGDLTEWLCPQPLVDDWTEIMKGAKLPVYDPKSNRRLESYKLSDASGLPEKMIAHALACLSCRNVAEVAMLTVMYDKWAASGSDVIVVVGGGGLGELLEQVLGSTPGSLFGSSPASAGYRRRRPHRPN